MTKTFIELEAIGIIAIFNDNGILTIITKAGPGAVWTYSPKDKKFYFKHTL